MTITITVQLKEHRFVSYTNTKVLHERKAWQKAEVITRSNEWNHAG